MIELSSEFDGSIHRLTLNRPARRNALTPDLARALAQEIEQIEEAGDARVILLSGAGGHFCAGLDLRWLDSLGSTPSIADLQHGLSDFQSAIIAVVRSPIPVLAVVQGTVAGFGFDLALACDMRLAGSSATFTSAFARMGLVPDGGSTFTLPRLVGVGRALRVLMTDQSIDARLPCRSDWWRKSLTIAELDAGVARVTGALLPARQLQRPGHQATLPGPGGWRAGAGALQRRRGAAAGAAERRVPDPPAGIHRQGLAKRAGS